MCIFALLMFVIPYSRIGTASSLMVTLYLLGWKISISLVFLLEDELCIITNSSFGLCFCNQNAFFMLLIRLKKKNDMYLRKNKHPCPGKAQALSPRNKASLWKQVNLVFAQHFWAQSGALHLCVHKSFPNLLRNPTLLLVHVTDWFYVTSEMD